MNLVQSNIFCSDSEMGLLLLVLTCTASPVNLFLLGIWLWHVWLLT